MAEDQSQCLTGHFLSPDAPSRALPQTRRTLVFPLGWRWAVFPRGGGRGLQDACPLPGSFRSGDIMRRAFIFCVNSVVSWPRSCVLYKPGFPKGPQNRNWDSA